MLFPEFPIVTVPRFCSSFKQASRAENLKKRMDAVLSIFRFVFHHRALVIFFLSAAFLLGYAVLFAFVSGRWDV